VFGCGGNRDKGKRLEMGKISGEIADFTVITSDNPRYEEPMDIIFDIEKGMLFSSKNYVLIQERAQAIKYALEMAEKDDVLLIAGKGSERYQEILGIKHVYNDKDTVNEFIGRNT
jgi:UDP-N-acetylmuramoyl-L-alanyl-D-glutamate--2,6-diaminopimelate ligase